MTRWILFPMVALLGGCIVYDTNGKCLDCDQDGHSHDGDNDTGTDNGGDSGSADSGSADSGSADSGSADSGSADSGAGDSGSHAADMKLTLDPDTAVIGTTFIGHLSSDNPDFDWSTVSSVTFYGGVVVLASDPDHGELDLAIQVPQSTPVGSADLLVETYDGDAYFAYDVLTLVSGG